MTYMDWDKLKAFYYVARLQSFSKASAFMNLSQPAISRQISTLESELGKKLFIRSHMKNPLTPEGEILFESTEKIFKEIEKAQSLISEEQNSPKGKLTVGVISGFSSHHFMPHVPGFLKAFPGIELSIIGTDKFPDITLREADILIHPKLPEGKHIIQKHLKTVHMGLFASPEYLKKYGTPKELDDLNKHKLISYGIHSNHPFPDANWLLTIGMLEGQTRKAYINVNTTADRQLLAEAGIGIISIPKEHPGLENSCLVPVLPSIEGPMFETYVVFLKDLAQSSRIKSFTNYFIEGMK